MIPNTNPNQFTQRAFLCHSSLDSRFVIEVATLLKKNLKHVFYYEDYQKTSEDFVETIAHELNECQIIVIFIGTHPISAYQQMEINAALRLHSQRPRNIFLVLLPGVEKVPESLVLLSGLPVLWATQATSHKAEEIVQDMLHRLGFRWHALDDLPLNPYLFSYEKDIIDHFIHKNRLEDQLDELRRALKKLAPGSEEHQRGLERYNQKVKEMEPFHARELDGCPAAWPQVVRWKDNMSPNLLDQQMVGKFREENARVVSAALSTYHENSCIEENCLVFPEAGPRQSLAYPAQGQELKVAILVSGGIAPGTNAVIDGITQRHYLYAYPDDDIHHQYPVTVFGFCNGFQAFDDLKDSIRYLISEKYITRAVPERKYLETSSHTSEGGSILGTSRYDLLVGSPNERASTLKRIVTQLYNWGIDILYVIGGDGSMRAAHAIWAAAQQFELEEPEERRKLSVVGVPKTVNNDILWVWQSLGLLSAVERAAELIEQFALEIKSNPRLGVVQLSGSDSGFVVSHAVLASRTGTCDAALIPELDFSVRALAGYMARRMCERYTSQQARIPVGFIVMAETAIPTDALDFIDDPAIGLTEEEKKAVRRFDKLRSTGKRIRGQTDDELRNAGLKLVSNGLYELLRAARLQGPQPKWDKLRVFTNAPRHLLRAVKPDCLDVITGQRLGILAVDNSLAGFTDFMVSQWLTEYVLVPLKLTALGCKRIPQTGIFWKSILDKTGQPASLV